jgi:hypothetical protein
VKKSYLLIGITMLLVVFVGCKNDVKKGQATGDAPQVVSSAAGTAGTVSETMDASGYTYVQIDTGAEKIWAAGPKTVLKVGDEVFIPEGSPISNFESKTLNRTFEKIIFASSIVVGGADQAFATQPPVDKTAAAAAPQVPTDFSGITKADGGKSVSEIFAEKTALNGQSVKLRGKVVKAMSGIMGKNWLHVKDGTGAPGTDDLVVTTMATAKVGDTVLVTGNVAADKDFGSGYRYEVIVEDAEITVE